MSNPGGPDLDRLLAILRSEHEPRQPIRAAAEAHGLSLSELYNSLALVMAHRFLNGTMALDEADHIANTLYGLMIEDAADYGDGFVLPQPAFAIYEALDAGEWDRGEPGDAVERYVKPMLEEILHR